MSSNNPPPSFPPIQQLKPAPAGTLSNLLRRVLVRQHSAMNKPSPTLVEVFLPSNTSLQVDTCKLLSRHNIALPSPRVESDMTWALQAHPSPPSPHSSGTPMLPIPQENSPPRAAPLLSHSQSAPRLPGTLRSQWSGGQWSSTPATPFLGHMLPRPIIGHFSKSVADESHSEASSKLQQPERRPSVNSSELTSRTAKRDQRSSVI